MKSQQQQAGKSKQKSLWKRMFKSSTSSSNKASAAAAFDKKSTTPSPPSMDNRNNGANHRSKSSSTSSNSGSSIHNQQHPELSPMEEDFQLQSNHPNQLQTMDQIPRPVRDQARQHFQPPLLLLYLVSFRCRLWLLELAVVEMVLVV